MFLAWRWLLNERIRKYKAGLYNGGTGNVLYRSPNRRGYIMLEALFEINVWVECGCLGRINVLKLLWRHNLVIRLKLWLLVVDSFKLFFLLITYTRTKLTGWLTTWMHGSLAGWRGACLINFRVDCFHSFWQIAVKFRTRDQNQVQMYPKHVVRISLGRVMCPLTWPVPFSDISSFVWLKPRALPTEKC